MGKKILFLIRSLHYGGAERQLVDLAKGLHLQGHRVKVVVFYSGGELENDLFQAGVPIVHLNKQRRWDVSSFIIRLYIVIQKERPDVLHSYLTVSNLLIIFFKPFFRRTRIVWGIRASNVDFNYYDWFARISYRIECKLSRFADLIICNSYMGKEYAVSHGFFDGKLVVIPNGIDTNRFFPDAKTRARIRAEWGILESEKLIGLVGRLDPMKDHETFIRAAACLVRQRSDVRFVCVGNASGLYSSQMKALSHALDLDDKLIWGEARRDMPDVYNAFDIAVSSSSGEGFPNVIAEAMACGVSCVVTDVGDSAQIVGNAGVVVPSKDPIALAAGISQILNRAKTDANFLHEFVRNRFSCGLLTKRTEKVLLSERLGKLT